MEKKKKLPLPLLILIISVGVGLVVAGIGLVKQNEAKKTNEQRAAEAYKQSQEKVDVAEKRIEEIKAQIPSLQEQYTAKDKECASMNMRDANWYADYTECRQEASNLDSQISALQMEQRGLEVADYTVYYSLVEPMSYQIFYIVGGAIAGLGALAAFIIYLVKGKKTY